MAQGTACRCKEWDHRGQVFKRCDVKRRCPSVCCSPHISARSQQFLCHLCPLISQRQVESSGAKDVHGIGICSCRQQQPDNVQLTHSCCHVQSSSALLSSSTFRVGTSRQKSADCFAVSPFRRIKQLLRLQARPQTQMNRFCNAGAYLLVFKGTAPPAQGCATYAPAQPTSCCPRLSMAQVEGAGPIRDCAPSPALYPSPLSAGTCCGTTASTNPAAARSLHHCHLPRPRHPHCRPSHHLLLASPRLHSCHCRQSSCSLEVPATERYNRQGGHLSDCHVAALDGPSELQ